MSNRQALPAKVAKARAQLQKAQARVAALEAQLVKEQPIVTAHEEHHHILDNMLEGCQIIGFDWRYLYVNEAAARHGQCAREELLGYTMPERYPGIEQSPMFAVLQRCMQERTVESLENEFLYPNGTSAWFELRVQPVPEGLFILSLDISARKQAEKALQRYAKRLEILHEIDLGIIGATSLHALVESALNHIRILFHCRQACVVLFDFAINEVLILATAQDVPSVIISGNRYPMPPQLLQEFAAHPVTVIADLSLLPPSHPGYPCVKPEGMRAALYALLLFQGQPMGMLALYAAAPDYFTTEHQEIAAQVANQLAIAIRQRDLTEALTHHAAELEQNNAELKNLQLAQKQQIALIEGMQRFLQSTLDAFPANTAVLDPDGTIITINAPWKNFAEENGAGAATYYLGANYLQVCDTAVGADAKEATSAAEGIRAVIAGRQDSFYIEYSCHSPTEERWFGLRATPFAEPAPRRVVVAHLNITERKRAENALQVSHHTLEQRVTQRTAELQAAKERVEAILNNSTDGILLIEPDLSIQQTNRSFNQLFGCAPDVCWGQSLVSLIEAEDIARVTQLASTVLAKEQGKRVEIRAKRLDGTVFDAELSIGLIKEDGLVCTIRDITERKAYERQLRYHANLQENVSDAVIVTDMAFCIQSWNRAAERMYGWHAEEVIGKMTAAILQTQFLSADGYARSVQQLRDQGWWQGEIIQQHKDGALRNMLGSVTLVKDERGIPFSIVAINHDITERKQAEEALQKSAAEIHDLYNNAPCGYHSLDQHGVIVQINDTELRWLGYTREEVVNKLKITDITTPESTLAFQKSFPLFKAQGWIKELQFDFIRKDGSIMCILLNGTAIYDENGQYVKSRSSLFDMTELKQAQQALVASEARYRLLAENVMDVIAKVNPAGIRTFVTPSCYALAGYRPDELMGKPALEIIHPEDRNESQLVMRQALTTAKPSFLLTQRIRHKAGHYVWVEVTTSIVRDPATGEPVEMNGVIRDITERKRAEAALTARFAEEREFQNYLKALHEITIELTQIDKLDTFYRRVIELGLARLGFERLALFLYDEKEGAALGTYGTDMQGNIADERHIRFTLAPNGIMLRALERTERFYFDESVPLYSDMQAVGFGWNAAAVLWNGVQRLGWLVADNLLSQKPASKPLMDTLGLYALTVGTLLTRKRVQIALRESEIRYRLLAENITDVVMCSNTTGEYIYISPSSRTVLGYEPEELVGRLAFAYIHPDDRAVAAQALLGTTLQSLPDVTLVVRFRHKQGHYIWLEASGRAIRSEKIGVIEGFIASARDISDRKRAEESLRESEERFRQIAENIDQILFIRSGDDQTMLYISPRYEVLSGRSCASLYKNPDSFLDLVHPDDLDYVRQQLTTKSYREEGHIDFEYRVTPPGNAVHWVRVRTFPIKNEDGAILRRVGIIGDITDRKQITAELERQRAFLRNVIDVSPNMIFVKDYDSRFVLVNRMVAKMHNTTVEAMIGKTDADFNPSRQEVNNFLEADRRVISSGEPLFIEEPITDADGETHWLHTTKVPTISADGKSKYVLGVAIDITERIRTEAALKASEEKYRGLVETMQGGLAVYDADDRVTYVNDRACAMLGYTRDEIMGMHAYDFVDDPTAQKIKTQLERRRFREGSTYELTVKRKDGSPVYLLISGSPLFDKNGEYQGSLVVTTDISAQKQAEEALRQTLVKEKELSELKSRFVSMASHEFRTPLATILALTETLSAYRHKLSEAQIDQRFGKIKGQIDHLKDIMEDVLLLARMQARRVEFNPILLDLDDLCCNVLAEFQSHAHVTHRLDYTCSAGAHAVMLDPKLMRQIISNLVSNAIKYSPAGKAIEVTLTFMDEAFLLKVRDEGIGIPESDLKHLFEPFHRATNVGAISGTGLGLVIAKESTELHGGAITVESQLDRGTTFTVYIPFSSKAEDDDKMTR